MRHFIFFLSLLILAVSCKPPLPVYFDQPIGTKVQGFDTMIAGNYLPLDDIVEKAQNAFTDKYAVKYDKILVKDSSSSLEANSKDIDYDEIKNIVRDNTDSLKPVKEEDCDSIFKSLCKFNKLISTEISLRIDRMGPQKPVAGMVKITYDRIFFIAVDSAGNNMRDTLLALNSSVLLTKYGGRYFINFKTPFGWEIMQLDLWEGRYLSVRPFYFTGYNDCSKTPAELTASTQKIYPNLSPLLDPGKKVIGFKAAMNPKLLLEKFKRSEEVLTMVKMK